MVLHQASRDQSYGISVENTGWEVIEIIHVRNNDAVHKGGGSWE